MLARGVALNSGLLLPCIPYVGWTSIIDNNWPRFLFLLSSSGDEQIPSYQPVALSGLLQTAEPKEKRSECAYPAYSLILYS